jgi:hypothetical protein
MHRLILHLDIRLIQLLGDGTLSKAAGCEQRATYSDTLGQLHSHHSVLNLFTHQPEASAVVFVYGGRLNTGFLDATAFLQIK